jgi:hypothetical protein
MAKRGRIAHPSTFMNNLVLKGSKFSKIEVPKKHFISRIMSLKES